MPPVLTGSGGSGRSEHTAEERQGTGGGSAGLCHLDWLGMEHEYVAGVRQVQLRQVSQKNKQVVKDGD